MAKYINKIEPISKKKGVRYEDAPEDIKGKGKMEDGTGICKFCGQSRIIKLFPGEDPDTVATNECGCSEARHEHDINISVTAVSKAIDKKFAELNNIPEGLAAIKGALEPVARDEIDSATFKISGFTFIVTKKDDKLACIKKYTEVDMADENGVTE